MNNRTALYANRLNVVPAVRPSVISILSGKGGVGKSTTAFHLARVLADVGRVMLVDADLLFGDLHIIANTVPQGTVDRFLLEDSDLRQPAVIRENLHLLASPSTSGRDLDIDVAGIVANLPRLPGLCADYDYLIIDTPSGLIDVIAVVASVSDIRLITVIPELTAISDGYGLIKYLKTLGLKGPYFLLPNRCRNAEEATYIYSRFAEICQKFHRLKPEYLGYVNENQYLAARLLTTEKDAEIRSLTPVGGDFGGLAKAILAAIPKYRKTNSLNRLQTANAWRSAADIKG